MNHYLHASLHKRMGRRRFLSGVATLAGVLAAACAGGGKNGQKAADYRNATPHNIEGDNPTPERLFWRRWFGPAAAPGKVQWNGKVHTLGACAPDKSTVTLDAHESYCDASAWAGDVQRAYLGCKAQPFRLARFDPSTNTHTHYTAPVGYDNAWGVCVTGGKVYVTSGGPAGTDHLYINVFNSSDETPKRVAVYEYDAVGESTNYMSAITTDGSHLYLGTEAGQILLVRISDMVLVDTLTLTHGGNVHAIGYNTANGYIYCTGNEDLAYKISRAGGELTEVAHYQHNCGNMTDDLAFSDTDLWLGPESGVGTPIYGSVLLLPLDTFDSHQLVVCGPPDSRCNGSFIDWDGQHMWTCWWQGASEGLTRTNLADMTHERIWLADDETAPNEVVQYDTNKYLIITWDGPARVINLTNPFPTIGLKVLPSGSHHSYWVPIRGYVEADVERSVGSINVYTDGENGLGTGWSAIGHRAKEYAQPAGTEEVTGDVLSTTSYPTLQSSPVDMFGWTAANPMTLGGSQATPAAAEDLGLYGTDYCFLVIQLVAAATVADGLSRSEVLTMTYGDGSVTTTSTATIEGQSSA